ncbi:Methenyltetrahydromethanopterin cyclohydrolase [Novipirellula galeiformis]|uniref:Methenyltetrahydromethanopterin cyclohydrolase n=1 Tax=Novipirellula galeiformis TaxID=2528004 RepID=A0A5C6C9Q4_9BACT|nr:methenyltetrahydromethanopterin cyclohydrolase [Novipirellula galeiformis]TWU20124.1 Methenyltetrahydromethanopterin cyclohydrolase [Novipirellula galeiformis]
MLNQRTSEFFTRLASDPDAQRCQVSKIAGATLLDAGIKTPGSLRAGISLARLCMADLAEISITPCDPSVLVSNNAVFVRSDAPLRACLAAQYAGWPVQTDEYFAMGSGPMRAARGREQALIELQLTETAETVVGVLESDQLPGADVIGLIADQCGVATNRVQLAIAPSTSIAGSVQVVARAIETAMHQLHELEFEVRSIVSATGHAPLPPVAKPGDTVAGIGRTNDAVLYGSTVTLWVDCEDEQVAAVAANVPSNTSADYGQPFATTFKQYDYDFYKVDPMLFSPAVVTIHNLRSGRTWNHGQIATDVLRRSFLS